MRIRRWISLLLLPLALAACEDATGSEPPIVGGWALQQTGPTRPWLAEELFFAADGGFVRQASFESDRIYHFRLEGEYRVRGGRLELRLVRQVSWNEDAGPAEVSELPGTWEDAGTVQLLGDLMVRTYVTFPADAPEETRAAYRRIPFESLERLD